MITNLSEPPVDNRIVNYPDALLADLFIEISVPIFTMTQDGVAAGSMLFIGS